MRARESEPFGPGVEIDLPLGTATRSDGNGDFRVSGDGRALYFTSHALQGGFGNSDIWFCRRVPKADSAPSMQSNIVYLDDLREKSYDGFVRLYKPGRNAQDAASLQNPFPAHHLFLR